MNDLEDQYRYLVGGYFGMLLVDEYPLKEFILKDIKDYIINFLAVNPIDNFNYQEEANKIKEQLTDKVKLQDLLIVLYKINADIEVELIVKAKLRQLGRKDYF